MREKLPRIPAKKVVTLLERKGFSLVRQSGSHKIYKNNSGVRVTVPYQSGKILHPKILKKICKDAGIAWGELS